MRHVHCYSRGRAQPGEPIENSGADLQFGDLAVKVTCHDAFPKQLEATHLGLDKVAPVITAPLLPDLPAKKARGRQDGVSGFSTRTLVLSWRGVPASGDKRLRPTLRDRLVTAFGVIVTIAADARHGLVAGIWSSRHGIIGASPIAL